MNNIRTTTANENNFVIGGKTTCSKCNDPYEECDCSRPKKNMDIGLVIGGAITILVGVLAILVTSPIKCKRWFFRRNPGDYTDLPDTDMSINP